MAPQLPTRQLGKNGPQVTSLGFGLMGLSAFYGTPESDEERFKVLDAAYERGERNWDSADVYQDNEELVGKWFKRTGKRDDIFIATKFSLASDAQGNISVRSDPHYVKEACERSLRRLGVKTIDLYYCHRLDGKTPIEQTVQAMAELKKEGKIKYLGLSECSAASLRRAYAVHPISAVQIEYSPFFLDIESPAIGLQKTCRELGVATIAYSPLGRGMLTGAYKSPADFIDSDFRKSDPRFSEETFPKNLALANKMRQLAEKKACTPGQLSLAWLLAQGDDVIPIPGTKKLKYLEENLGALNVKLSSEEVREIRNAIEALEVHGARYAPAMLAGCFADTPPLKT